MDEFTPSPIRSLLRVMHRYNNEILYAASDEINIMHWNIGQLDNKLQHVELLVASYHGTLHIIVISETWLTMDNFSTYQLNGYYAIHNIRHPRKGGGISIFIHESLCTNTPTVLADVTTAELHHFLAVKILHLNMTLAIPYNRPKGRSRTSLFGYPQLPSDG